MAGMSMRENTGEEIARTSSPGIRGGRQGSYSNGRSRLGFTLPELLTVVTIVGVLLAMAGLHYRNWIVKLDVERQTRQLLADLRDLRLKAMFTKRPHRAILNEKGYVLKSYASADEPPEGGLVIGNKTVAYPIGDKNGTAYSNYEIAFNSMGMTNDFSTITVGGGDGAEAGVNCVSVHYVRTSIGVLREGICIKK